jgi:cyanophycin synthetase
MEFRKVWVLRGANRWIHFPALEVEVFLHDPETASTSDLPGFGEQLAALTGLRRREAGQPPKRGTSGGGRAGPTAGALDPQPDGHGTGEVFLQQLERGTSLAHVLQHLTLLLQLRAGSDVAFGTAQAVQPPTFYRVVVEYEEELLAHACLEAARDLCLAALHGGSFDAEARTRALCELAYDVRLGPSTGAIVRAARERNIPTHRLNEGSLVQLGQGVQQRRILTAETDRTGAIAEAIAQDKELTRKLLRVVGVPVPDGRPVKDAEDAWEAAQDVGVPVVVKPQFGNHGRGVATNLMTREQVLQAHDVAKREGSSVIVETFIPGEDHRLLVVGDRLVAAARREPAQVIGDGQSTVRQLIDEVNKDPRRSDGHATVLSIIKLDSVALGVLQEQGYTPDSVPADGQRVLIRRNGNLSTGGTATDVTDEVHPEVAARVVEAARVVGLDIAGVDVVATDLSRPLEGQHGAVVEVNAGPGLRMHLQPSAGKPRAVGEAIVEMLYPNGHTGRVPVVAVTGVNGKTTTTWLIAHLLRWAGKVVGMTCTDGAYVGGRQIDPHDCSGPRSARAVLLNPRVEAAVLETARGGILREGLGFDRCDVAVVTNVGASDPYSLRGVETLEDLARVKQVVVEAVAPTGSAVLNADDPLVAAMAEYCPGSVVFFTRAPQGRDAERQPSVLTSHRADGGRAVFVRDGTVVLAEGAHETPLVALAAVPLTHGGRVAFQVENVLAAAAAGWALGLSLEAVRNALTSFAGDERTAPGRFNVHHREATVVVDYAHNPSALRALVTALDTFPANHRTAIFCSGDRCDADVTEMGLVLGAAFDRVLLYPDGPDDASMTLVRGGLAAGGRAAEVCELADERAALAAGFAALRPGDLLVVIVEAIEALGWVHSHLDRIAPLLEALPAD